MLFSRLLAGKQRAFYAQRFQQLLRCAVMLRGQHLGRRHQRALIAGLCRQIQRAERNGRLAAAYVALHEPRHRSLRGHIAAHLFEHAPLRARCGKRQRGPERVRVGFLRGDAHALFVAHAQPPQERLKKRQLLESETAARLLQRLARIGEMRLPERILARAERIAAAEGFGQRVVVAARVERGAQRQAHRLGRQLFDGPVYRLNAAFLGRQGMRDEQPAVFFLRNPAVPLHARAGFQLPGQPGHGEPHAGDCAGIVAHGRGGDAAPLDPRRAHLFERARKGGLHARPQRGDGAHRVKIAVADGQTLRQLFGRGKAGRLQRGAPRGADSLDVVPCQHNFSR